MSNDLRIVSRCLMVGGRDEPLLRLISFLSHFLTETWSYRCTKFKRRAMSVQCTYYIAEGNTEFGALPKATKALRRVYRIINSGPGFLVVVWFGYPPNSSPLSRQVSYFSFSVFLCVAGRAHWREGAWKGRGVRSRIIRSESLVLCKSLNTLWALALAFLISIFDIFLAV
jgi:hypothetical protein